MSRELTNKEKHEKMWRWLTKHAEETLDMSPSEAKEKATEACRLEAAFILNTCFVCEEVAGNCSICPIDWEAYNAPRGSVTPCTGEESLYDYWGSAKTLKRKRKYAKLIATAWGKK